MMLLKLLSDPSYDGTPQNIEKTALIHVKFRQYFSSQGMKVT